MKILSPDDMLRGRVICTIGYFDGVHRGHAKILKALHQASSKTMVVTFAEHPYTVLCPDQKPALLTSFAHKTLLLEQQNIDYLLCYPCTPRVLQISYQQFLQNLKKRFSVQGLILGKKARFGYRQGGDEKHVRAFASALSMDVQYVRCKTVETNIISSTRIRLCIAQGKFKEAKSFLGRAYSFFYKDRDHIILPRPGRYAISFWHKKEWIQTHLVITISGRLQCSHPLITEDTEIIFRDESL
jgi:riboflavin kinase/FMN adenylyltransferase